MLEEKDKTEKIRKNEAGFKEKRFYKKQRVIY